MSDSSQTVLVSSTVRDLPGYRELVMDACIRAGYCPAMMEHLPSSSESAKATSRKLVEESDLYLGIFAHSFGSCPTGDDRSYTEIEFDEAAALSRPIFPFFIVDSYPWPANMVDTGDSAARLRRLKSKVSDGRIVARFTSPEDLRGQVIHALYEHKAKQSRSAKAARSPLEQLAKSNEINEMQGAFVTRFWEVFGTSIARIIEKPFFDEHVFNIEATIRALLPTSHERNLSELDLFLLRCGAFVHDIGQVRCSEDSSRWPHDDHHNIGERMWLENAHHFGLPRNEITAIAMLTRAHRKIDLSDIPETMIVANRRVSIRFLCALLRLADFLDFGHGTITSTALNIRRIAEYRNRFSVLINPDTWSIHLSSGACNASEVIYLLNLRYNLQGILNQVHPTLDQNGLFYRTIDIDNEAISPLLNDSHFMTSIDNLSPTQQR